MAEEVLTGFLTDSAKSVLEMVASLISQEIKLAWGFKDDLKNFHGKLEIMVGMVSQAESSSDDTNNVVLQKWMKKVKSFLYDAEDVLEMIAYELLKFQLQAGTIDKTSQLRQSRKAKLRVVFSWSSNPLVFRLRSAHKVKALRESMAEIYANAKELGIKPVMVAAGSYNAVKMTTADKELQLHRENPDVKGMIGREANKAELIDLLCKASNDTNNDLNVIGICGIAGLGKTTLAKCLLETTSVKDKFDERITICVSHDFDLKKQWNNMVEQLYKENKNFSSVETIKEKLQDKLKGKKYLLFVDDVWDTLSKVWEPLRSFLLEIGGSKGTTILVTSRSQDVVGTLKVRDTTRRMVNPHIYQLNKLSADYAWTLFQQRLGGNLLDSEKAAIAGRLIQKCGGVPLAINTLAGLLEMQEKVEEWREIEKSKLWDHENDIILPSVKLSFKYLPSIWVKKCFAYCAIFKEDEEIDKVKLIQLWMAQGFLEPYDAMEAMGEKYFNLLLGNSFFQDEKFDKLGNVVTCKMHDIVHKLAQVVSGEEVWYSSSAASSSTDATNILHLGLNHRRDLPVCVGERLRTLTWTGEGTLHMVKKVIEKTKCLRSLSLVSLGLQELPESIGELLHLKYLDVSQNGIRKFPHGLTKLYSLLTLRAEKNIIDQGDDCFPELPSHDCDKLINLKHLHGCFNLGVPNNLGLLTSLETIPPIDMRKGGKISELENLNKLKGTLSLKGLETLGFPGAGKAKLWRKKSIEELSLTWNDVVADNVMQQQIECLFPHPNLRYLILRNYRCRRVPLWLREMAGHRGAPLSRLVHLEIRGCDFRQVSSLNNLVALKTLNIQFCSKLESLVGLEGLGKLEEIIIDRCGIQQLLLLEGLVALKRLVVEHCPNIKNLENIPRLPCLQDLQMVYCRSMTGLPDEIASLQSLQLLKLGPFNVEMDYFPFPILKHEDDTLHPITISLSYLYLDAQGMKMLWSLPTRIQSLVALTTLHIWDFSNLVELPEWLGNLPCLRELRLNRLPILKILPSQNALRHLTYLEVFKCPVLEEACDKETRSPWSNIQHIPRIIFNGRVMGKGGSKNSRHKSKSKPKPERREVIIPSSDSDNSEVIGSRPRSVTFLC